MSITIDNTSPGLRRAWHPVLRADELGAEPVRVELLGEGWMLARIDGEVRAFADRCPHRSARLSDGQLLDDGTLQCPYHGWRFDGSGRCRLVPALGPDATVPPAALTAAHLVERYGLLWLAPDEPLCDVLPIAEFDDPALDTIWIPPVDVAAGAAQIIDNFLDFAHFPFVHAGTFGSDDDILVAPFETRSVADGWGFVVEHDHTIENHEDPLVATGEHPLVQPRSMRYEYRAPFTANLRLDLPLTGMVNAIVMLCQPLDHQRTRVHMAMIRNDCPTDSDRQAAIEFELRVFDEDLAILERLPDPMLTLDRGQVHTRVDRHTVEYRRILRRLLDEQ